MHSFWVAAAVPIVAIVLTPAIADPSIPAASEKFGESPAESPLLDAMRNSRNENSTPRNSILPVSPAITGLSQEPTPTKESAMILRTKAFLLLLGYDVGRLDARITAKFKAAIFRYQQAHGLPTSGELDDVTLGKLGVTAE